MVESVSDVESLAGDHPTGEQLRLFAIGALEADSIFWMEKHVSDCEICCQHLESAPDDHLVQLIRKSQVIRRPVGLRLAPGYQILDELGRGGMGIVYRAIQPALNRQVAVKMLGQMVHASHEELTRFRVEAEASAALNHPNIVQVYEIGEMEGQPYIAMELVRGCTLAEHLLKRPLEIGEAIELLVALTQAMQHAHACGIIHRDLKPSNILLEENGSDCTNLTSLKPKIVDFGLAKRIDVPATLTSTGAIIGTPSYMSPELAAGEPEFVGHSTDIYSLGAILYESLVGRPPFKGATAVETLTLVQTAEPAKLSTLRIGIPRDLETICLKCLEKSPSNRFHSTSDLLADLRRFKEGRPILAKPASLSRRSLQWTKRHPAIVGLIAVSLLACLGVLTVGLVYSSSLRGALHLAENERGRADENFQFAFQAVDRMLDRVGHAQLADTPEMEDVRERLLADAVDFYSHLIGNQPRTDVESRRQYYGAMSRLGRIQWALGLEKSSLTNLQKAIELQQQLLQEFPERHDLQHELANSYINKGQVSQDANDYAIAVQLLEKIADVYPSSTNDLAQALNNLAVVTASIEEREELHLRVEALREAMLAASPDNSSLQYGLAQTRHNLAFLYFTTGRSQAAESAYNDALGMFERLVMRRDSVTDYHVAYAECLTHTASMLHSFGRTNEAIALIQRGTATRKVLAARFPKLPAMREAVIRGLITEAAILIEVSQFEPASLLSEQAVEMATQLVEEFSTNDQRFNKATSLTILATALLGESRIPEAKSAFELANITYDELLEAEPENARYQTEAGVHFMNFSNLLRSEAPLIASEFNDRSVALLERAFESSSQRTDFQSYLFNAHGARARTYELLSDYRESARSWSRALELAPPHRQVELGLLRAFALVRGGEFKLATEAANVILKEENLSGADLYNLACIFGLIDKSSPKSEMPLHDVADQAPGTKALELLSRKTTLDFLQIPENLQMLVVDQDLESVRALPSFNDLINRIDSK